MKILLITSYSKDEILSQENEWGSAFLSELNELGSVKTIGILIPPFYRRPRKQESPKILGWDETFVIPWDPITEQIEAQLFLGCQAVDPILSQEIEIWAPDLIVGLGIEVWYLLRHRQSVIQVITNIAEVEYFRPQTNLQQLNFRLESDLFNSKVQIVVINNFFDHVAHVVNEGKRLQINDSIMKAIKKHNNSFVEG